jgi:DNA-binding winged helix-turn-helix (wHTH) protein
MALRCSEVFRRFFESPEFAMRLRFDEFVFDTGTRELRRADEPVPLPPKTFRFLEVLLERRPEAVSKTTLMDLVWPDTYVTESSLARLATELRTALGDNPGQPRFLRTVYGFGYAFCGEALDEHPAEAARAAVPARGGRGLRLVIAQREIALLQGENILGRDDDARVHVDSARASRRHASITVAGGRATIEDLASKNGTFLRGRRITEPETLRDGDEIVVGPVLMTFRTGPARATETDTALRRPV